MYVQCTDKMFWKRYVHLEVYTKPIELSKKQILRENGSAFMQNIGQQQQQQQQNRDSAKRD